MIHTDGSLVCHDGGFYTRKSFQAELGAAAALVRLHMQTGMAVNVDRILRKIQKEQDIILHGTFYNGDHLCKPEKEDYPGSIRTILGDWRTVPFLYGKIGRKLDGMEDL